MGTVEAYIPFISFKENVFQLEKLSARSAWHRNSANQASIQPANRNHIVLMFTLEALNIVHVLALGIQTLRQQIRTVPLNPDILFQLEIPVKKHDFILIAAEFHYVDIFLPVIGQSRNALVLTTDKPGAYFERLRVRLFKCRCIDYRNFGFAAFAAACNYSVCPWIVCESIAMAPALERLGYFHNFHCTKVYFRYFDAFFLPVVKGEICISFVRACSLHRIVSVHGLSGLSPVSVYSLSLVSPTLTHDSPDFLSTLKVSDSPFQLIVIDSNPYDLALTSVTG